MNMSYWNSTDASGIWHVSDTNANDWTNYDSNYTGNIDLINITWPPAEPRIKTFEKEFKL